MIHSIARFACPGQAGGVLSKKRGGNMNCPECESENLEIQEDGRTGAVIFVKCGDCGRVIFVRPDDRIPGED